MSWELIVPGVHLYPDSYSVYGIECPEGYVIINPGTGAWFDTPEATQDPIVLSLTANHHPYGQITEALVTIQI